MTTINIKEIEELGARLHQLKKVDEVLGWTSIGGEAADAIDAFLAFYKEVNEQKPVAYRYDFSTGAWAYVESPHEFSNDDKPNAKPLYAHPPPSAARITVLAAESEGFARAKDYWRDACISQETKYESRIAELESKLEGLRTQVGIFNGRFDEDQARIAELEKEVLQWKANSRENKLIAEQNIADLTEKLRIAREALVIAQAEIVATGLAEGTTFGDDDKVAEKVLEALAALGEE